MGTLRRLVLSTCLLALRLQEALSDTLSRDGWNITASSWEPGNEPEKVFDDDDDTFWHSRYEPDNEPLPHHIVIDMKKSYVVNGFSYFPRQGLNTNGQVSQHQVHLSQDGENWGEPVIIGTYMDDKKEKETTFADTAARYVRFTALTEIDGNPWTSVAEINILSPDATASGNDFVPPPVSRGKWGPTIDFPIVPAALAVLNNSDVLTWSAYMPDNFGMDAGYTHNSVWDTSSGVVSRHLVDNTHHDMFCPGASMDEFGRAIITGGSNSYKTSVYDPGRGSWMGASDMQISRGYQSSTTLSDGRIFTIGGSWSGGEGGKDGEVYNVTHDTWTELPGCKVKPMLTDDAQGVYRADNHAWLFGWKGNKVFQAGPSKAMNWYGMDGEGSVKNAGNRSDDSHSMNGNAVMFDAVNGKILSVGGAPDYQDADATNHAHIITIGDPEGDVEVTAIEPMAHARGFHNSVVLPDGKVLVVGGQSHVIPFTDDTAAMIPELFDPATNSFSPMNPINQPRTYHSVAALLPDGTVISGGGGLCGDCGVNHFDAQIFRPPYFFKEDGSLADRPVISDGPEAIQVGDSITVTTDSSVKSFSLVRYGTSTHAINTDQRRIPLTPSGGAGENQYKLEIPDDSGIVLPGYWMLFAMDGAGVPSEAWTVRVRT